MPLTQKATVLWIKTTLTEQATLVYELGCLDTEEDAYAVLAIDFEHFLCPYRQKSSTLVVKTRLFHFVCLQNAFLFIA